MPKIYKGCRYIYCFDMIKYCVCFFKCVNITFKLCISIHFRYTGLREMMILWYMILKIIVIYDVRLICRNNCLQYQIFWIAIRFDWWSHLTCGHAHLTCGQFTLILFFIIGSITQIRYFSRDRHLQCNLSKSDTCTQTF